MATETPPSTAASAATAQPEKRPISIFELPKNFFDACHLVHPSATSIPDDDASGTFENHASKTLDKVGDDDGGEGEKSSKNAVVLDRWTCNTCKAEFESLEDQRSHFKLDVHRFNVKLSMAGKDTVNEEDFDELTSDSFKDFDVSSISGSEDEDDKGSLTLNNAHRRPGESFKQKLFVRLQKGEKVSLWRSLLLDDSQSISYESDKTFGTDNSGFVPCVRENQVIEKLKSCIHEPRDGTHLRIVLLASAGHFAGCVFDGNLVVAHKTFHRYVVRAKAGKKQSSKDGAGRTVHSAGASLRRYNELALKKDIQELLGAWKTYFDASLCVFIHAPSNNRQLLFNGEKPYFSNQNCVVRKVPSVVRRPTLKEARRIYNQLTQVSYEVDEKEKTPGITKDSMLGCNMSNENPSSAKENLGDNLAGIENTTSCSSNKKAAEPVNVSESESEVILTTTPLHEAAETGNVDKVLELLEQGLDPCIKDGRGRTPYMLASEKEVRNTFRRYMGENLDKWDWHAAKVPSPLTKEMEESQTAKQAEKDAKKKARAKELKKLRKAKEKEKKAQAEATSSQNASGSGNVKGSSQPTRGSSISKEEEAKRAAAAEREKRAAAAERRLAAAAVPNAQVNASSSTTTATQSRSSASATDIICSCCHSSLEGKVPFHRYNYKYCSTSCMHVHKQILEDDA